MPHFRIYLVFAIWFLKLIKQSTSVWTFYIDFFAKEGRQ
jgi:hypothetical protein